LQENRTTSEEFDEPVPIITDHCALCCVDKETKPTNSETGEEGTETTIENRLENTTEKTADGDKDDFEDVDEVKGVPQKGTTVSPVNVVDYNLFLSYAWGEDHQTHDKVKILADLLIEQGERPFFDSHNLRGNMKSKISKVLASSPIFVTVLTKEYNKKVEGESTLDYCFFELNYATVVCKKKILVILDKSMRNKEKWCPLIQAEFANMLYIDLCDVDWKDKDAFNHPFAPFAEEILRLTKKK
jgi:hypothetical protein